MTDVATSPDPVAARVLAETGDVKKAITRLTSLHWTKAEAEAELRLCLSNGARRVQKAKQRSVSGA